MAELAPIRSWSLDSVLQGIIGGGVDGRRRVATGDGQTFSVSRPQALSRRADPVGRGTRLSIDEEHARVSLIMFKLNPLSLMWRDRAVMDHLKITKKLLEQLGLDDQGTPRTPRPFTGIYEGDRLRKARTGVEPGQGLDIYQGDRFLSKRKTSGR